MCRNYRPYLSIAVKKCCVEAIDGCTFVPALSALFTYGRKSVPGLSAYCIKAVSVSIYVVVGIIVLFDAALHQAHY